MAARKVKMEGVIWPGEGKPKGFSPHIEGETPIPPNFGPWDTIFLSARNVTYKLPGLAHVEVTLEDEVEVKKPKGRNGATITFQGRNPLRATITLRMWSREQLAEWFGIHAILRVVKGQGERGALRIEHAKVNYYGVDHVIIKSIKDAAAREGFSGEYEVTIECVEWLPSAEKTETKTVNTELKDRFEQPFQKPAKPSTTGNRP